MYDDETTFMSFDFFFTKFQTNFSNVFSITTHLIDKLLTKMQIILKYL